MSSADTELQRGWQIHQQKNYAEAESIYRTVLKTASGNANGWCFLGIALHDQRKYREAVDCYENALRIRPEFPIALNNLGNTLRYVGEVDRADASFQKAIDLKPDYLNAYKNRGTLHVWTGGIEKGLEYYAAALKINPNEPELHRNLGVIYLLQGDFERGWQEYRWRWHVGDLHRPFKNVPVWDGSDPNGKAIVLTAEQGLGDTINFVRFAKVLRERGAQTIVYCQAPLVALLQASPELGPIFPNTLQLQSRVHWQCSLLDAADVMKIDAQSIPASGPYLKPSANLESYWQEKFPRSNEKFRVGISWQGNPDHQADAFRSFPVSQFERLAENPNVELVVLQSGYGKEQVEDWKGRNPLTQLQDVDASSGAFMDTTAIMRQLDLVITSDTAIAHVAGAIGVPTWIVLGYIPDWRWLMNRSDSPWYSTVRLFRQSKMGDWNGVFDEIRKELDIAAIDKLRRQTAKI